MAALTTPELSDMFELLTHPHRRYVLYYLTTESNTATIDTLVSAIATWDGGQTGPDRNTDRDALEAALHHKHLPKLADAGMITVSADSDSIELRETNGLNTFLGYTAPIDGSQPIAADD